MSTLHRQFSKTNKENFPLVGQRQSLTSQMLVLAAFGQAAALGLVLSRGLLQLSTPDMILKRAIRPAAEAAGVKKRIGWHTFRHSLATNLRGLGVDVEVAPELRRHANSRIAPDIYTQAVSLERCWRTVGV